MLWRSEWSVPAEDQAKVAFDWHVNRYADWLDRAGAESRTALVLSSGAASRRGFLARLAGRGVEIIEAKPTREAPIHPLLAEHRGDHFNRKLFVMDLPHDEVILKGLADAAQRVLVQHGTWVAAITDDPQVIALAERVAPALIPSLMWRCLVLSHEGAARAPVSADLRGAWWATGRIAELVFHYAVTDIAPHFDDFDRLCRAGYAALDRAHPERARLAAIWRDEAPNDWADLSPVVAEALGRRRPQAAAYEIKRAAALADFPLIRAALGEAVPGHPDARAAGRLKRMAEGLEPARAEDIDAAALALRDVGPWTRAWVSFAEAAARAMSGDLHGCAAALEVALADGEMAPELRFDALEKRLALQTFAGERGEAKRTLLMLEALWPVMESPFYEARFLLARGAHLKPLDPQRAGRDLTRAEALFAAHGYPTWAAEAREG